MDGRADQEGRSTAIVALTTLVLGLIGAGKGFANGDAAAYAAQSLRGDVTERVTHFGYGLMARGMALVVGPESLPWVLDAFTALCGVLIVVGAASLARRVGGHPAMAAGAAAVALAPLLSWAEVDLPWAAAVVWAAAVPARWAGAALLALAVTISPTAILAAPWVAWMRADALIDRHRHDRRLLGPEWWREAAWMGGGVIMAIAGLSGGSAGGWWIGDRGVLAAPAPMLDRSLAGWVDHALLPGVTIAAAVGWLRARRYHGALLALPLMLAPADVPGWVVLSVSLAVSASHAPTMRGLGRGLAITAVALQGLLAVGAWDARRVQVRNDMEIIRSVTGALRPNDALAAEWTWGVRASVVATGDEYELNWRVLGPPVRDQADRWCGQTWDRVGVLPPGKVIPGVTSWDVDPHGVHWVRGEDLPWDALPGCR